MSSRQITIKDIARQLNVSASTVSRALHDHPQIGRETKEEIKSLAEKLGYQPNSVAMSLRQKKTFTIGVIVPEIVHYFFSSVISGIEDFAIENNYQVILCQSNEKYSQELISLKTLSRSRVDGILISVSKESKDFKHIEAISRKGIPVVFYDRAPEAMNADCVIVDDFGGAYQATDHLIRQGCQNIAHFMGPQHLTIHSERKRGYIEAHAKNGLSVQEELIIEADSFKSAYRALHKLKDKNLKFDGIFAVNDLTAVGAMKAVKSIGLKVPGEVAVVGFGDDSTLSAMVEPTLSSVVQPGYDMGHAAASLLLDRISGDDTAKPKVIQLPTQLRIRQSSKFRSIV